MRVENLDEVLKSFDTVIETLERKLKAVVKGYIMELTTELVKNTPYGSLTINGEPNTWYERRSYTQFGAMLDESPGTARNAWKVSFLKDFTGFLNNNAVFSGSSLAGKSLEAGPESGQYSFNNVRLDLDRYEIGDLVILFNNTPYIANTKEDWSGKRGLEYGSSRQAPTGISEPTVDQIMAMYKAGANIKAHFDGG